MWGVVDCQWGACGGLLTVSGACGGLLTVSGGMWGLYVHLLNSERLYNALSNIMKMSCTMQHLVKWVVQCSIW